MTTNHPLPSPPKGIRCECGGELEPTVLAKYDFSDYVGFEVNLNGFEGLKCNKCGDETLDGRLVNAILNHTVVQAAKQPRRLNGKEARFLRHHLCTTQEELAVRMGVVRETVAKWECGDSPISPAHDYMLRAITLGSMIALGLLPAEMAQQIMKDTFTAVRPSPPQRRTSIDVERSEISPMLIAASDHAMAFPRAAAG